MKNIYVKNLTLNRAGDKCLRHCGYYQQRGLHNTVFVAHKLHSLSLCLFTLGLWDFIYLELLRAVCQLGEAKRCNKQPWNIVKACLIHKRSTEDFLGFLGFPWKDSSPLQHPLPLTQRRSKQTISGRFAKYRKGKALQIAWLLKHLPCMKVQEPSALSGYFQVIKSPVVKRSSLCNQQNSEQDLKLIFF